MSRSLTACMLWTVRFPFKVRTHATLATMTKLEWLVHRILSFTVRTHATLATMTKLEWLVHRILSFTVRTRDSRNDDIDTALCGARSSSPQLTGNGLTSGKAPGFCMVEHQLVSNSVLMYHVSLVVECLLWP